MRTLLIALLLLLAPLAQAQTPPSAEAYVGRAAVADQSDAARDPALVAALAQVLERVSGRAAGSPEIQALAARAPRLVQRYSYVRDSASAQLLLVAGFDPRAVDSALRAQTLPVWGVTSAPAEELDLSVSGLQGIRDYARALAALRAAPALRALSVTVAEDDRLWLRARVEGGAAGLADVPGLQRAPEDPLHFSLATPAP